MNEMHEMTIASERVLCADGSIAEATIRCAGGLIQEIAGRLGAAPTYDAQRLLVLPAIVDLHGDGFERHIHPRPGVPIELDIALADADRQMVANGIVTAFHGLTVTWEPGPRDLKAACATIAALQRIRPRLCCDTKLHLRHEALSLDTVDIALEWIANGIIELVAINDHGYMVQNALTRPAQLIERLQKAGIAEDEYRRLADHALSRRGEVPASLARIASAALANRLPLASHDDDTPEERVFFRGMGCRISEFPADHATAQAAIDGGDAVVMGAPNILRGRSHCGRVSAIELIHAGLCTALCSDYYYPSIFYAPFRLAASGHSFAHCWDMVSSAPARIAGCADRGTIEAGKRADLLLVDDSDPLHPQLRAGFAAGAPVYTRGL